MHTFSVVTMVHTADVQPFAPKTDQRESKQKRSIMHVYAVAGCLQFIQMRAALIS